MEEEGYDHYNDVDFHGGTWKDGLDIFVNIHDGNVLISIGDWSYLYENHKKTIFPTLDKNLPEIYKKLGLVKVGDYSMVDEGHPLEYYDDYVCIVSENEKFLKGWISGQSRGR